MEPQWLLRVHVVAAIISFIYIFQIAKACFPTRSPEGTMQAARTRTTPAPDRCPGGHNCPDVSAGDGMDCMPTCDPDPNNGPAVFQYGTNSMTCRTFMCRGGGTFNVRSSGMYVTGNIMNCMNGGWQIMNADGENQGTADSNAQMVCDNPD